MSRFDYLLSLDKDQLIKNAADFSFLGTSIRGYMDELNELRTELIRIVNMDGYSREEFLRLRICFEGLYKLLGNLFHELLEHMRASDYFNTSLDSRDNLWRELTRIHGLHLGKETGRSSLEFLIQNFDTVVSVNTPIWHSKFSNIYVCGETLEEALGVPAVSDALRADFEQVSHCPVHCRFWITEEGKVIPQTRALCHLANKTFQPGIVSIPALGKRYYEADVVDCTDGYIVCRRVSVVYPNGIRKELTVD